MEVPINPLVIVDDQSYGINYVNGVAQLDVQLLETLSGAFCSIPCVSSLQSSQ